MPTAVNHSHAVTTEDSRTPVRLMIRQAIDALAIYRHTDVSAVASVG